MNPACDYVAHGLALVHIGARAKGPNKPGWNKPENAITDPDQAEALTGNIGLAHAYPSGR